MRVNFYLSILFVYMACQGLYGQRAVTGVGPHDGDLLQSVQLQIPGSAVSPLDIRILTVDGQVLDIPGHEGEVLLLEGLSSKSIEAIEVSEGETSFSLDPEVYTRDLVGHEISSDETGLRTSCGSGTIPYINCDFESYNIDRSLLEDSTFTALDNDYITCIGFVDENCNIGQSFTTFCTYYPGESAGHYPPGYVHYDQVIGIADFTDATGISVTDRQGEELNWVLCNAENLGYTKSQMNSAIWGILNQVSCNWLCNRARAAISYPTGLISPKLEFYVPRNASDVQPQLRNQCVTLDPEILVYDCGDNRNIDTYVKGMLTLDPADRYIDIPNPANVVKVVAEVWIEPLECPATIPSSIGVRASLGGSPDVDGIAPGTDVIQTSASTTVEKIYRYVFDGSFGRIEIKDSQDWGCNASSMAVYVVRDEEGGTSALNTSVNREFDQSEYQLEVNIGASTVARDVNLSIPIHEIGNNGRRARIEAWYTGGPVSSMETDMATEGLEASVINLTVPSVPDHIESIHVRVISPTSNGESFGVGSVSVSSDEACCPAVIASAGGSLGCNELACGPCDGRITVLTLQYTGSSPDAHVYIEQQDGSIVFDQVIQPGEYFTFSGTASQSTFGPWIDIWLNGSYVDEIHTSCSLPEPMVGQTFGSFLVIEGESKNGGPICAEDGSPVFQSTVQLFSSTTFADPVFEWSGPNGYTSAQENPAVTDPGIYTVLVTDLVTGCTGSDTALVVGMVTADCWADNNGPITCARPVVLLNGSSSTAGATFEWSGPNGFSAGTEDATVTEPGIYWLTVTSPDGCSSTCQTIVEVDTNSYSRLVRDTICEGSYYTLPDGGLATAAGTYVHTLPSATGCDSTITTILELIPFSMDSISAEICEGSPYMLPGGETAFSAGVYVDTFTNVQGCDSLVITSLTVLPSQPTSISATICSGEVYHLPLGEQVDQTGIYRDTLTNSFGCDSIVTVNLTVLPITETTLYLEVCEGDTAVLPNGQQVISAGTYSDTLTGVSGCDSIVHTVLNLVPASHAHVNAGICDGESYTLPSGQIADTSGIYTDTLVGVKGCDSIVTVHLEVFSPSFHGLTIELCEGEGHQLPDGEIVYLPGSYMDTLLNHRGCDSILETELIIVPAYEQSQQAWICEGSTFTLPSGQEVSVSGSYSDTLTSSGGCDSVIVVSITVVNAYEFDYEVSICSGETFTLPDGTEVGSPGTYIDTLVSTAGCDSIIRTLLKVFPNSNNSLTAEICEGEIFVLPGGQPVSLPGTYTDTLLSLHGCDSVVTTELTVRYPARFILHESACPGSMVTLPDGSQVTVFEPDTFTVQLACDSILEVIVEVLPVFASAVTANICEGEAYTLPGGEVVYASGMYVDSMVSAQGCDSLITTALTVHPAYVDTMEARICEGDIFILPGGDTVASPGFFEEVFLTSSGCDSVVVIRLSVTPEWALTQEATICEGQTLTLPGGEIVSTPGIYVDSLITASGCDSILTTIVTSREPEERINSLELCEGTGITLPDGSYVLYTEPGTDTLVIDFGCDSVVTYAIVVYPTYRSVQKDTICGDASYTLPGGQEVHSSGIFTDTFLTVHGCDSLVITELMVLEDTVREEWVSLCEGDPYQLPDGEWATEPGTYSDTLVSPLGCYEIVVTHLEFLSVHAVSISDTVCAGQAAVLPGGDTVYAAGIYTDSLQTANGCDSVVTFQLTVLSGEDEQVFVAICEGGSYTLASGTIVQEAGIYVDTLETSSGCQFLRFTELVVHPAYMSSLRDTICPGEVYVLPGGEAVDQAGTYMDTFKTVLGCDSIVMTQLTVLQDSVREEWVVLCEGDLYQLPDGSLVSQAGTYADTLHSPQGCFEIVLTHLEFRPAYTVSLHDTICAGQTAVLPGGDTVFVAGIYTDSLQTLNGCDSVVIFQLTVLSGEDEQVSVAICEGESYTLANGTIVQEAGMYVDTLETSSGCSFLRYTELIVHPVYLSSLRDTICPGEVYVLPGGEAVDQTGSYMDTLKTVHGCDSVWTIHLYVRQPVIIDEFYQACEGEEIILSDGSSIGTPAHGMDTIRHYVGCDSVVRHIIYVLSNSIVSIEDTICEGSEYILPWGQVVRESGVYSDTLTGSSGCDSITRATLTVLPSKLNEQVFTACGEDFVVLPDGQLIFRDTVIESFLTATNTCDSIIRWEVHISRNTAMFLDTTVCRDAGIEFGGQVYTEAGNYVFNLENHAGCDSIVVLRVHIAEPFYRFVDTVLCDGQEFAWEGSRTREESEFMVTYTTRFGCDSTYHIRIRYAEPPEVIARKDTTVQRGAVVEAYTKYQYGDDLRFEWSINNEPVYWNVKRFTDQYFEDAEVTVEVTDRNNCRATDAFRVFVKEDCPENLISAPNLISPNGDGANDYFRIRNPFEVEIEVVEVYNRWGEVVYSAGDFSNPWDGRFREDEVNPDVYTYYIRGYCSPGNAYTKVGNITVVR